MKKLKPKDVQSIFMVGLIVGALTGFIGAFYEHAVLCCIGGVMMFGMVLFRVVCYRCPHCGKFLDRSTGPFCPHCGKEVNE